MAVGLFVINTKVHESEQKSNVRKSKTMGLDEPYKLVTIVLALNSHYSKIHDIFLTTIAVAVQLVLGTARQRLVFNRDGHLYYRTIPEF